jgi:hypothetical protein
MPLTGTNDCHKIFIPVNTSHKPHLKCQKNDIDGYKYAYVIAQSKRIKKVTWW